MKSIMKRMVRAYDKELCVFRDMRNSKKKRRATARQLASYYDEDVAIECQEDADEFARDDIYYMVN
ncbi:TPA: hypothetical protein KML26_004186 [Escherichia coli]|nr:MAG TPA: hypothetical protein [Caudoviricetes sp.]HBE6550812.1 hypothetical protein [Escherichia coli]